MNNSISIRLRATACVGAIAIAVVSGCATPGSSADRAAPALTTERIAAIVASPDRSAADRQNDVRRKPVEMLTFIGVRPGMVALDVSAGGGYTTELIARSVGPTGRVYGQSPPPNPDRVAPAAAEGSDGSPRPAPAPRRTSAMALAERAQNPNASNIVAVQVPFDHPVPADLAPQSLDLVTLMFNYHDLGYLGVNRASMNATLFTALKPGGLYVIADHAGRAGTGISESGTLHRVEEEFVVGEVQAAGFKLVERGTFLRNPADPRDRNTPDPPMPKDEFVLKFMKPT
jgi:predicted methyltransferase